MPPIRLQNIGLGDIYIYIYIPIPQLSIPRIPILPRAVSILGSLQFQYDTSVQFSSVHFNLITQEMLHLQLIGFHAGPGPH